MNKWLIQDSGSDLMTKKADSGKEAKITRKKEEPEYVETIEYEKFCDFYSFTYNKGIISILLGQEVYTPAKVVCKIWIDPQSLKEFSADLASLVKEYEKRYGKIE